MSEPLWAQLRARVKSEEGLRLIPYDDATGKPVRAGGVLRGQLTIGYGRNLTGRGITMEEAESLLDHDLIDLARDLPRLLPFWSQLDPARQLVLADMAFNLGLPRLLKFEKTLRLVAGGAYAEAAEEMLRSDWANALAEVGSPRARDLAEIMRTGRVEEKKG